MLVADIRTEIQKYCGRNYTDFNNRIDGWINRAIKDKVLMPHNLWFMKTSTTKTTTSATRTISLPDNYKDDQDNSIYYRDSSNNSTELDIIDEVQARRDWSTTDTGTPEALIIGDTTAEVWPLPNGTYNIDFEHYSFLADLSDSATSNWLSINYPNLYIFAGVAEGYDYLGEHEEAKEWWAKFYELVNQLTTYNILRQTGSINMQPRPDVGGAVRAGRYLK